MIFYILAGLMGAFLGAMFVVGGVADGEVRTIKDRWLTVIIFAACAMSTVGILDLFF